MMRILMVLAYHAVNKAVVGLSSVYMRVVLGLWGVRGARGLRTFGVFGVYVARSGLFQIGSGCTFSNCTRANHVGLNRNCHFSVRKDGRLRIGNNCGFSGTVIYVSREVTIGDNVLFGGNCTITDSDHHPLDCRSRRDSTGLVAAAPVTIEDDVWVGLNATILKGVRIGRGAVIAAGALVVSDVPPLSIAGGVPARIIGSTER